MRVDDRRWYTHEHARVLLLGMQDARAGIMIALIVINFPCGTDGGRATSLSRVRARRIRVTLHFTACIYLRDCNSNNNTRIARL